MKLKNLYFILNLLIEYCYLFMMYKKSDGYTVWRYAKKNDSIICIDSKCSRSRVAGKILIHVSIK